MTDLPATPLTDLALSSTHPDTRAAIDAELRAHYYAEAEQMLRAKVDDVRRVASNNMASGLLLAANLLRDAPTGQED